MATIKEKTILPDFITLKDININTNSETNGFNLLNLNTKEINRVINLLLKRVFEIGEEQDIDNIINTVISAIENRKKKFKLPFDLQEGDIPANVEHHGYKFEIRREDELTFSISRIENEINSEWETSATIVQVKSSDGIVSNCSIITKNPQILIQFATIPDEDHWIYIL